MIKEFPQKSVKSLNHAIRAAWSNVGQGSFGATWGNVGHLALFL